ncbi:MAG: hypothetical protein H6857_03670 [Rhodospirillales bacterium]|nr:hypothetical protein [Rhodospirillales bacterium]
MTLPLSIPGQSKNILLVGDEGISVYNVSGGGMRYIDHLAWLTPDFEYKLKDTLRKDCPKTPVAILYDMVEQHYRKEMVPKVGPIDKKNVVARKVAISFPNYKIRTALELKVKKGKQKEDNGKGLETIPYLFAAIPTSELLSSLLRAVVASGLPIDGLYLLPVEGVSMVSKLSRKLGRGDKRPARWTLFIGQHASGNLRQIVVKDGELALTRMTPFSEDQENAAGWVHAIHQEYKVTISYLSRLGYKPEEGMNIVLIGPDEADSHLGGHFSEEESAGLMLLSTKEAADLLGVSAVFSEEAEYSDVLYVAWLGQGARPVLSLPVDSFEKVKQPRLIASLLLAASAVAALWFGYQAALSARDYAVVMADLDSRKAQLKGAQEDYARLLDEKEKEGYDIRLYKGSFTAEQELDSYAIKPFTILKGVSEALGPVLTIDEIMIRHEDGSEVRFEESNGNAVVRKTSRSNNRSISSSGTTKDGDKHKFYSRMSMTFSAGIPQEEANKILNGLVRQLKMRMPEYEINIEKAVKDRSYQVDVEGQIGGESDLPDLKKDNTAVIEIRGDV